MRIARQTQVKKTSAPARRRRLVAALLLGLALFALSLLFDQLLLPALFPQLSAQGAPGLPAAGRLGWLPALAAAFFAALGLPYFALLSFLGLALARALEVARRLAEGLGYPSLNSKVLLAVAQGGPFLIGAFWEYARFMLRSFRRLRGAPGEPEPEDGKLEE